MPGHLDLRRWQLGRRYKEDLAATETGRPAEQLEVAAEVEVGPGGKELAEAGLVETAPVGVESVETGLVEVQSKRVIVGTGPAETARLLAGVSSQQDIT